jgi:hypothetical protein
MSIIAAAAAQALTAENPDADPPIDMDEFEAELDAPLMDEELIAQALALVDDSMLALWFEGLAWRVVDDRAIKSGLAVVTPADPAEPRVTFVLSRVGRDVAVALAAGPQRVDGSWLHGARLVRRTITTEVTAWADVPETGLPQ